MSFGIPKVGTIVRVTTRYQNIHLFSCKKQPTFDIVMEGEVLPLDNLDHSGTWNIATGKMNHPVANIAPRNVVALQVLKGEAVKHVAEKPRTGSWMVMGSKGNTYTIVETSPGGPLKCNCIAGQYNRPCKHKAEVDAKRQKKC